MRYSILFLLVFLLSCKTIPKNTKTSYDQIQSDVEIIVDQFGIPHIYAQNQSDLFFAQGYHAAKDRLFQFEVWRRQATGTVAEILGKRELKRDIGTRLFKFRKDIRQEMNHYHEDGEDIISSYVNGVNAYITEMRNTPDKLPIEFKLLNILPEVWTPEVVISRHQGLLGNINQELSTARAVAAIGEEKVKDLIWFHPKEPDLRIDSMIDLSHLDYDILGLYNAYRQPLKFQPEDIDIAARNESNPTKDLGFEAQDLSGNDYSIGSNNWVVKGERTTSGYPIMANDPHRTLAVPSLRYMAHLVAPGWNVIGGGEPEIPGISIGHNEHGAWGLTVFRTDAEDLYVYKTNPKNLNQYWHKGEWLDFTIIKELIEVKGMEAVEIDLKYSIHGPVCFEDSREQVAFAVKCGWLEYGGSPYLASLRMDQAKDFDEFREACRYSHIPGENMVWADREGNIGWQVVGINPYRRTHSGMVPVPGDGRYEWDGYIDMLKRPNANNPESGYIITANASVTPPEYTEWDAIAFNWSDPYRGDRVKEVIESKQTHSIEEMSRLQADYLSLPARELIPLLDDLEMDSDEAEWAKSELQNWDFILAADSRAAALYVTWERLLKKEMWQQAVPAEAKTYITSIQLKRVIDWLTNPSLIFKEEPERKRDEVLKNMLAAAVVQLSQRFGDNKVDWVYGSPKFKQVTMRHPMSQAVTDEIKQKLEVGPHKRGGNSYTVGSTGGADNQPSGGTFRVIIDTGDWDSSIANNSPGQSGDPDHPHYRNLFDDWSRDSYFPLFYSKEKIETIADYRYTLAAAKNY